MSKANPKVFLELSIDGHVAGRITFELFSDIVPRTAENFLALCTGERGRGEQTRKRLDLKNTLIYRIVKGFVAQGGDLSNKNGLVGESIYGGTFTDENFERKHDKRGLLSMANSGPHSNGSLFFITLNPLPNLDGKHVVFGEAVSGVELLHQLEAVSTDNGRPSCNVWISDCGQVRTNTQGEVDTRTDSRGVQRKKRREHHSSDSTDENSNGGHRKRRSGKDKHKYSKSGSERKKKRKIHSSDSYSDDSSDGGHGRKRRRSCKEKHKSLKRESKHRDSKRKSRGSRRKSRRNDAPSSESDDSRASTSDDERGG